MTPRPVPAVVLPDVPPPPTPLGLIAGGGRLPVMVARGMREAGHSVRCVAFRNQFDPELPEYCDTLVEAAPLRPGSWIRALRRMRVDHAVMVGRIDKARFMHNWRTILANRPDWRALRMYLRLRHDRRSGNLLAGVADELALAGVELIDSTSHITEHLASRGVMTLRQPGSLQRADIEFGWPILRDLSRLDVGQAIAVRHCDVVAVEAVEGTDRMIERAGELCRAGGWTLLKAARAGHDRRADVPTIGPNTIRHLHRAGAVCVGLAAGDVIIIDKPQTIALADELGIAIIGLAPM